MTWLAHSDSYCNVTLLITLRYYLCVWVHDLLCEILFYMLSSLDARSLEMGRPFSSAVSQCWVVASRRQFLLLFGCSLTPAPVSDFWFLITKIVFMTLFDIKWRPRQLKMQFTTKNLSELEFEANTTVAMQAEPLKYNSDMLCKWSLNHTKHGAIITKINSLVCKSLSMQG